MSRLQEEVGEMKVRTISMRDHTNPCETWTRGVDLTDGSFNKETWDRIVADILSVELAEAAERTTA